MAYNIDDWRLVIEGMTGPTEKFSNTWSFHDTVGTGDVQDVADALNQFYLDLAALFGSNWSATNCRARNLSTNIETVMSWTPVVGSGTDDILPTQLAIRVSLNSLAGVNGGPFLSGFLLTTVDSDGTGTIADANQATIATTLGSLNANLAADDWWIGIDRPTVPSVERAVRGRVGKRFDVIRKRSNDTPEAYATVSF